MKITKHGRSSSCDRADGFCEPGSCPTLLAVVSVHFFRTVICSIEESLNFPASSSVVPVCMAAMVKP